MWGAVMMRLLKRITNHVASTSDAVIDDSCACCMDKLQLELSITLYAIQDVYVLTVTAQMLQWCKHRLHTTN